MHARVFVTVADVGVAVSGLARVGGRLGLGNGEDCLPVQVPACALG
jgi:hypothetical protein